jgi:hypothetical protein
MIKIRSMCDAEIGDFINYKGKVSIISSVQQNGDYLIIGLKEGEVIVALKDQKTEIFRVRSKIRPGL